METVCLLNQKLWDNFIFGQVNYQKLDHHIQNLVEDIIKKNNLNTIMSLSDLCFGNDNVSMNDWKLGKNVQEKFVLGKIVIKIFPLNKIVQWIKLSNKPILIIL